MPYMWYDTMIGIMSPITELQYNLVLDILSVY